MNEYDVAGKSLLQRMLDFRNRAEELRVIAENMHEEPGLLMLSLAASYDRAAETVQALLSHSAAPDF